MSLASLENLSRAHFSRRAESRRSGGDATAAGRAEDWGARTQRDNDFLGARAAAQVTIAICERLLDNPTDPDTLAAARQHLDDNPQWVHRARLFMASQQD